MEVAVLQEETLPQLWNAYKKTPAYKSGMTKAIPPHYKLVIKREKEGLTTIYKEFVSRLLEYRSIKDELRNRQPQDWLAEWKQMHSKLFEHIFRQCGNWRKKEIRFGNPGDEELHKIPKIGTLHQEIAKLADDMHYYLSKDHTTDEEKYKTLAKIHYQFIRIHPFNDGNGRIARALTDQLAIYFGFPVAMGGFPRHDSKRREAYHKAIRACVDDPECQDLAYWIKSYIYIQLNMLA